MANLRSQERLQVPIIVHAVSGLKSLNIWRRVDLVNLNPLPCHTPPQKFLARLESSSLDIVLGRGSLVLFLWIKHSVGRELASRLLFLDRQALMIQIPDV